MAEKKKVRGVDSRHIVDRVEVFLDCWSFPSTWPPLVGKQVEPDVRIRAMIGESYEVSEEVNKG